MRCALLVLGFTLVLASAAVGQPIAVMSVEPNPGCVGGTITFDGSGSAAMPPFYLVLYEWDFDGDGHYDATGMIQTHVYTMPGTYYPGLRVTDSSELTGFTFCDLYISSGPSHTEATTWGSIKALYR